jgi:hypothetical protein
MPEANSQKRPARILTVENFSVIKHAKLEFGKITVLIGPQSSGKSLLCKLAFFFECRVPEILLECLMNRSPFQLAGDKVIDNFRSYFPEEGREGQEFHLGYEVGSYFSVGIEMLAGTPTYSLNWKNGFEKFYTDYLQGTPRKPPSFNSDRRRVLMSGGDPGLLPIKSDSVYIPTGRAFFSTPNRAFTALSTKNLDWITNRFATEFDAEYTVLRESYQTNRAHLGDIGSSSVTILKGRVVKEDSRLLFESVQDGKKRSFGILSSGTLELLPILNIFAQVAKKVGYPNHPNMPAPPFGMVYIEEPELSVFPETQYQLAKLIGLLAHSNSVWKSYAITTHSPYILTAFNNLIEAGQAARNNPNLHDEVARIIPEMYWIKDGDFKAYAIENGKLKSILNESGFIEGNYLDQVSEVIGDEFDKLLRLEYEHTKAS